MIPEQIEEKKGKLSVEKVYNKNIVWIGDTVSNFIITKQKNDIHNTTKKGEEERA